MNTPQVWNSVYFLVILISLPTAWSYKIFYLTDYCDGGHMHINMKSLGSNSSGILKLSEDGNFQEPMHCEVTLNPPLAYGVVASVRLINLPKIRTNDGHCNTSYLKIYTSSEDSTDLCGYSNDENEYKSFEIWNPMKIIFHSESQMASNNSQMQFQITFTAARKASLWCSDQEFMCRNQRCIWLGHTCDGHNNCGDLSDESSVAHCGGNKLSIKESTGIIIGTVAFCSVLVIVVAYLRRQRSRRYQSFSQRRNTLDRSILSRSHNSATNLLPAVPPPKYEDIQRPGFCPVGVSNNSVSIHVENMQNQRIN